MTVHHHKASLHGMSWPRITIAEKEWGSEEIICRQPHACKVMRVKPGKQVSLHWHEYKSETFVLINGSLIVETYNQAATEIVKTHLTIPLTSITIDTMVPHTFYCPDGQKEDTVFIEASTTDCSGDSYRIYPSGPRRKDPPCGRSTN